MDFSNVHGPSNTILNIRYVGIGPSAHAIYDAIILAVSFGQADPLQAAKVQDALDYMLEVDKRKREHALERWNKAIHEAYGRSMKSCWKTDILK